MTQTPLPSKVTIDDVNTFFAKAFVGPDEDRPRVNLMEHGHSKITLKANTGHLRPGGLVSGPTQMAIVDQAAYAAVFTLTGITPMAVTSSLNMTFLRACTGAIIYADARILKFGRTLVVAEVTVTTDTMEHAASQAVVTYALPRGDS